MICEISKITKRGTDEFAAKASILLMFRFEYGSLGLERTLAAQDGTAISLPVEGPHPEVPPNRSANAAKVRFPPKVPITQRHQHERTQQYHAHTLRFPNDTTNTRPYCVMRVVEER